MKTNLPVAATFLLLAFAPLLQAQTTYSVVQVSATLPGQYEDPTTKTLVNLSLNTKAIINIALGNDITTAVPPNVVLGFAGVFSAFAHHQPDPTAPAQLVVFDKDAGAKLRTVGVFSDRTVAENEILNRFKRVATATLAIQDSGMSVTGKFLGGSLTIAGAGTRHPNLMVATPATVTIVATSKAVGAVRLQYKKGTFTSPVLTLITSNGSLRANGKVVGSFIE